MALSKKHFERIASEINDELNRISATDAPSQSRAWARKALHSVAINLCSFFREENPAFDGQRFLKACGF